VHAIESLHFDSYSHSLQRRHTYRQGPTAYYARNNASRATALILNNDQSVSLIPKMGSHDYKFLNPGSQD